MKIVKNRSWGSLVKVVALSTLCALSALNNLAWSHTYRTAEAQPWPLPWPEPLPVPSPPTVGQTAWAAKTAHLRAGPARDYPVVAILSAGTALDVMGCLRGYTWCDVVAGPYRGWVYAANIRFRWEGREVPAPDIGAQLGIGIIGFILGEYWTDHYRDQHFYRDRDRWPGRRPGPPAVPAPPPVAPRPAPPPASPRSPMPGFPFPMPAPKPGPGASSPRP
jgi:uncharacterized protein YraI